MKAYSKEELLSEIDSMVIYEKDYKTIQTLLLYDPRLAASVIEEVIKGNLYWSDFETILPKSYGESLEKSLATQDKLSTMIEMIIKYNESTGNENTKNLVSTNIALSENFANGSQDLARNESEIMREEFLYPLLTIKSDDNALTRNAKAKLLNAIENGRILKNRGDQVLESGGVITENSESYRYIDPDALLMSNDKLLVPVDYDLITLSDSDRVFIYQNNISETEMKKIKATYLYLETLKNINSGGS